MIWYDSMFVGTGCQSKLKMLKRQISHRAAHPPVYLITLPTADHRVLEIVPSALLLQKQYPADDLRIIGMACTRREAIGIVQQLVSESFRERGDADIEAYLREYGNRGRGTA